LKVQPRPNLPPLLATDRHYPAGRHNHACPDVERHGKRSHTLAMPLAYIHVRNTSPVRFGPRRTLGGQFENALWRTGAD
jgi:hypothetical protein